MRKIVLLLLLPLLSLQALRADDSGSWLTLQLNKGWEHNYAFLRLEHRSFNDFSATEAAFLSAGAGMKILPWLKTDLSYEYWTVNPDVTVHKAVLAGNATIVRDGLSVSVKEKLEFSVNPASSSTGFVLRSRLRAQYDIRDFPLRPYAMAETFNWDVWIRSLYYAGAEIPIGEHNLLDLFYLYHVPAAGEPVHLLGIGWFFNF